MNLQQAGERVDLLSQLRQDHLNMAKLLDLIEAELAVFDAGDSPDYGLMFDIVHYLSNYPDQIHHPNEDLLFQRLLDRATALRPTIDGLFGEHEQLAKSGHELQALLEQIVDDAFVQRDVVHNQLLDYLGFFRRHIGTEERDVFPHAEQLLGTRDWLALNAEFAERVDPLFGDIIAHEYQAIADSLAPAATGA